MIRGTVFRERFIPEVFILIDALSFTGKCRDTAVICDMEKGMCITPGGSKLVLVVVKDLDDLLGIKGIGGETLIYFPDQRIAYEAKRKTGSMVIEFLDSRLEGISGLVIAGLHVVASWEFDILARNKWSYIYLPIDASFTGDFVPLFELVEKGVNVALGSGAKDALFDVCDFRGVVWTALINQYNILRDDRSILGVWRAALGGWRVYGLKEPEYVEKLYAVKNLDKVFEMIYLYSRKQLRPEELVDRTVM
jgi:hypothetical protein